MNLLIDVGNSNTTMGVSGDYNSGQRAQMTRIKTVFNIPTNDLKRTALLKQFILKNFKRKKIKIAHINNIAFCSVVPKLNMRLKASLKAIFKNRPILIIDDQMIPIVNKYDLPHQVGKDRLINALAVKEDYNLPAIVVDFGTAITIDVINEKAEYLGGVIVPGINLSLNTLYEKTALLPLLSPTKPIKILGTNTQSSILSGIFYGYAFLVDGMIRALKTKLKKKFFVIATGGNLHLIKPLVREINIFDQNLTLKGIEKTLIFKKNKEK